MKIDFEKVEQYREEFRKIAAEDYWHNDCPELQIETLSLLAGSLIENNANGENNYLIAFYVHVGRSLKELIKYRQLKGKQNE